MADEIPHFQLYKFWRLTPIDKFNPFRFFSCQIDKPLTHPIEELHRTRLHVVKQIPTDSPWTNTIPGSLHANPRIKINDYRQVRYGGAYRELINPGDHVPVEMPANSLV